MPFCLKKCPYCDFFSVGGNTLYEEDFRKMQAEYAEAAAEELAFYGQRNPVSDGGALRKADTVYFGGGTPSILPVQELEKVLSSVHMYFSPESDAEITLEANPATVTAEKLHAYRAMGINRLSIGAQSMDDGVLKVLGRMHSAEDTVHTVELARKAGFDNISLDLMFAIPGQSTDSWLSSVKRLMELEPEHISLYSLEFIENTKFWQDRESGVLIETDAEADRRMYESALELMARKDYLQYEISNVSYKGKFKSRHNLKYWNLSEYMGIGPSAHSFVDGARYYNIPDTREYIDSAGSGQAVRGYIKNTFEDNVSEYIFTGLRKNEGISLSDFAEKFGMEIWDIYDEDCRCEFEQFVDGGLAEYKDGFMRLTVKGMNVSNRIMSLFV